VSKPYVTKLTSNLKSPDGMPFTVTLAQHTVLVGENEAGKSAIMEALQLAVAGEVFGLAYRPKTTKAGNLLVDLIPADVQEGFVEAEWSDGGKSSWSLERGKRPVFTAHPSAPSSLPLAMLHEVFGGSSNARAELFLTLMGGTTALDQLKKVKSKLKRAREAKRTATAALASLGALSHVSPEELTKAASDYRAAALKEVLASVVPRAEKDPTAARALELLVEASGGKEVFLSAPSPDEALNSLCSKASDHRLSQVGGMMSRARSGAEAQEEELKGTIDRVTHGIYFLLSQDEVAAERASSFLPAGEKLILDCDVEGRKVSIALRREGEDHYALSGSTEARVLAALACALAPQGSLIPLDDRMWSKKSQGKTLKALKEAPHQVVLPTTLPPTAAQAKGWAVLTVERSAGEPLQVTAK